MRTVKSKGQKYLQFELLSKYPNVSHGVFLEDCRIRHDISRPYSEKNQYDLGKKRRSLFASDLGFSSLWLPSQCHTTNIEIIKRSNASGENLILEPTDALITQSTKTALGIFTADCQSAIFFDPLNSVIANVHCGFRGNAARFYSIVVDRFVKTFHSDPEKLIVCISPSLGPRKAEFVNYEKEFPKELWKFKDESHHFNLWEMSVSELLGKGVLRSNIEVAKICTFEREEDFFSYRRDKTIKRHLTLVGMR